MLSAMTDCLKDIKHNFCERTGFFNQKYFSLRTSGFELTLDNITPTDKFIVCLCTPYDESLDKKKHHDGIGGGEVKESWSFDSEEEALNFIDKHHLL